MVLLCQVKQGDVSKMGLKLSKWSDGDGVTILDVAKLALTDINYHHEARILHRIQQLLLKNEQDFELIWGDRINLLDKALKEPIMQQYRQEK